MFLFAFPGELTPFIKLQPDCDQVTFDAAHPPTGMSHSAVFYTLNSASHKLYRNNVLLSDACTSFLLRPDFLLYTTHHHKLISIPIRSGEKNFGSSWDERQVERGSRLVTSVANQTAVVLQLPRGNLEIIHPRALVIAKICDFLRGKNYAAAFDLTRKHRVNMNLLVDVDVAAFLRDIPIFVTQIGNSVDLNIFIAELSDENVTATVYRSHFPPADGAASLTTTAAVGDKKNRVLVELEKKLDELSESKLYLSRIACYIFKRPQELEKALFKVMELMVMHHSIDWLSQSSIDWLFVQLIWLIERISDWLIDRAIDWLINISGFFSRNPLKLLKPRTPWSSSYTLPMSMSSTTWPWAHTISILSWWWPQSHGKTPKSTSHSSMNCACWSRNLIEKRPLINTWSVTTERWLIWLPWGTKNSRNVWNWWWRISYTGQLWPFFKSHRRSGTRSFVFMGIFWVTRRSAMERRRCCMMRAEMWRKQWQTTGKEYTYRVRNVTWCNWLIDWLIDWLIVWAIDWLSDCSSDWLIVWAIDWLFDWLFDWLISSVMYAIEMFLSFRRMFPFLTFVCSPICRKSLDWQLGMACAMKAGWDNQQIVKYCWIDGAFPQECTPSPGRGQSARRLRRKRSRFLFHRSWKAVSGPMHTYCWNAFLALGKNSKRPWRKPPRRFVMKLVTFNRELKNMKRGWKLSVSWSGKRRWMVPEEEEETSLSTICRRRVPCPVGLPCGPANSAVRPVRIDERRRRRSGVCGKADSMRIWLCWTHWRSSIGKRALWLRI